MKFIFEKGDAKIVIDDKNKGLEAILTHDISKTDYPFIKFVKNSVINYFKTRWGIKIFFRDGHDEEHSTLSASQFENNSNTTEISGDISLIPSKCFYNNTSLKKVSIPDTKELGVQAFDKDRVIHFYAPKLSTIADKSLPVYVPTLFLPSLKTFDGNLIADSFKDSIYEYILPNVEHFEGLIQSTSDPSSKYPRVNRSVYLPNLKTTSFMSNSVELLNGKSKLLYIPNLERADDGDFNLTLDVSIGNSFPTVVVVDEAHTENIKNIIPMKYPGGANPNFTRDWYIVFNKDLTRRWAKVGKGFEWKPIGRNFSKYVNEESSGACSLSNGVSSTAVGACSIGLMPNDDLVIRNNSKLEYMYYLGEKISAVHSCDRIYTILAPRTLELESTTGGVFRDNPKLRHVELPSVDILHDNEFLNCASLEYLEFPSVLGAEPTAFKGCNNLKILKLPKLVELYTMDVTPSTPLSIFVSQDCIISMEATSNVNVYDTSGKFKWNFASGSWESYEA